MKITGHLRGRVNDEDWLDLGQNTVVTDGLELIIDRLEGTGAAAPDYLGIGTGSTAANVADTTLETEVESRVQGTITQPTAVQYRVTGTLAITGTRAITEAGLLNASTSGTLAARRVFSAINLTSGDSLQLQWTLTISS